MLDMGTNLTALLAESASTLGNPGLDMLRPEEELVDQAYSPAQAIAQLQEYSFDGPRLDEFNGLPLRPFDADDV